MAVRQHATFLRGRLHPSSPPSREAATARRSIATSSDQRIQYHSESVLRGATMLPASLPSFHACRAASPNLDTCSTIRCPANVRTFFERQRTRIRDCSCDHTVARLQTRWGVPPDATGGKNGSVVRKSGSPMDRDGEAKLTAIPNCCCADPHSLRIFPARPALDPV